MKNNLITIFITLIASLFCSINFCWSQQQIKPYLDSNLLKKNSFQVNLTSIILQGSYNINYERILFQRKNIAYFGKVGYGKYVGWSAEGSYLTTKAGAIFGKSKNKLELGAGLLWYDPFYINETRPKDIRPTFNVGYRFQKPNKNFSFRTGFSVPEGAYVGIGFFFTKSKSHEYD